jgi:hypothetical protein
MTRMTSFERATCAWSDIWDGGWTFSRRRLGSVCSLTWNGERTDISIPMWKLTCRCHIWLFPQKMSNYSDIFCDWQSSTYLGRLLFCCCLQPLSETSDSIGSYEFSGRLLDQFEHANHIYFILLPWLVHLNHEMFTIHIKNLTCKLEFNDQLLLSPSPSCKYSKYGRHHYVLTGNQPHYILVVWPPFFGSWTSQAEYSTIARSWHEASTVLMKVRNYTKS